MVLAEDLANSDRLRAGGLVILSRTVLDLLDDLENPRAIVVQAEMRPAGKGLEDDALDRGEVTVHGLFSSPTRIELSGPVVPNASQIFPFDKGSSAVDAGPVQRASDEPFLACLREDIAETSHLSLLFVADSNRSVSPPPDFLAPSGQTTDYLGKIALEVLHEAGELPRRLDAHEKVDVIGEECAYKELDVVAALSPPEDPDEDLVEATTRPK